MPPYRLPFELELYILELATPPALLPSLKRRVDFLLVIALVHRSFTAWAQARLREQFVFTYRSSDPQLLAFERRRQQAELLTDWKPECFLLDLRDFFYAEDDGYGCDCTDRHPSNSDPPRDGPLRIQPGSSIIDATGSFAGWPARFPRFHVYLSHAVLRLSTFECPPILDFDDSSCGVTWDDAAWFLGQTSQASALTLRHFACYDFDMAASDLTRLVLVQCDMSTGLKRVCDNLPKLADLVLFETYCNFRSDDLAKPHSLRRFIVASPEPPDDDDQRTVSNLSPPALETFTFILLRADHHPDEHAERAAAATRQAARTKQALQDTNTRFILRIATGSDEEELANVMLALGL